MQTRLDEVEGEPELEGESAAESELSDARKRNASRSLPNIRQIDKKDNSVDVDKSRNSRESTHLRNVLNEAESTSLSVSIS
jgi:hypothetical protein